jgi:hypothetical protein
VKSEGKTREGREFLEKRQGTSASLYFLKGEGGEGGYRAAKPDRVIHRYISNPKGVF